MILDKATQILHSSIDKVILGLVSLTEVFEDHLNLSRLFLPLVRHVSRVELPEHVIFTLHLAYLRLLCSYLPLGLAELCLDNRKLVLGCK